MGKRLAVLLTAIVVCLWSAPAVADDTTVTIRSTTDVTPQQKKRAVELFDRGNAFFVKRQYTMALEQYERAVAMWDHPPIRAKMAVCKLHMGRPLEAYHDVRAGLVRYRQGLLQDAIYAHLLTLEKTLLGQLSRVQIECEQPGAVIYLDGDQLFKSPGKAESVLTAGKHHIVATKPAYRTTSKLLTLLPGKTSVINIKIVSLSAIGTFQRRWKRWKPLAVVAGGAAVMLAGVQLKREAHTRWRSRTSVSLIVAGGVALALGMTLGYMNRARFVPAEKVPPTEPLWLATPILTPNSVGLAIRGSL